MQKLKTVFVIDRETGLATDNIQQGAEWIFEGKGKATVKVDGSSVLKKEGKFYRRLDRKLQKKYASMKKHGKLSEITPEMFALARDGWVAAEAKPDLVTGHWPGWMPLNPDDNADKYHWEAVDNLEDDAPDGTYELVGPTVQQNIYGLDYHLFVKHGHEEVDVPRTLEGIQEFLETHYIEGLVFHPEDDSLPMFKVRRKDFGIVWNPLADRRHYPEWKEPVNNASL